MSTDDAETRAHYEGLVADHTKRLRVLERQAALQGLNTPPEVTIEIEHIQREIARLNAFIKPAIDQIQHLFVRGFLERAAAALSAKDYDDAAGQAIGGLLWALRMVEPALLGRDNRPTRDTEAARLITLFQTLHLDYTAYLRISNQVGTTYLLHGSTIIRIMRTGTKADVEAWPPIGPELASQALTFCTRAIVSIEAQAGDLGRPFGQRGIRLP